MNSHLNIMLCYLERIFDDYPQNLTYRESSCHGCVSFQATFVRCSLFRHLAQTSASFFMHNFIEMSITKTYHMYSLKETSEDTITYVEEYGKKH